MSAPVAWILVHDLGTGGVPTVLVRYLAWLRQRGPEEVRRPQVHVVARHDGTLATQVRALADSCTILGPAPGDGRSPAELLAVAAAQAGRPAAGARIRDGWRHHAVRQLPQPDVVLVHGAGGWPLWRSLAPAAGRCRLVLHLHELSIGIARSVPAEELAALVGEPDVLAAVCAPDDLLGERLGARADELVVVPGCADPVSGDRSTPSPGTPEVVAVGEAGWRKGTDRFEALAHELARRRPSTSCRWIGAPPPPPWRLAVGSPSPVRWEGSVADPWALVPAGSLVVLPSREDPLPLAALEAGARCLAVVASGTGGLAELLDDDRGWFVRTADLRDLVDRVEAALADPTEAARRGERLQAHVAAQLSPAAVGPRWLELLAPE